MLVPAEQSKTKTKIGFCDSFNYCFNSSNYSIIYLLSMDFPSEKKGCNGS